MNRVSLGVISRDVNGQLHSATIGRSPAWNAWSPPTTVFFDKGRHGPRETQKSGNPYLGDSLKICNRQLTISCMAKNPPTVRMRRLGAQLRKIREERGLTLDEAADLLKLSKSALGRMETAQVITRSHEVEYLLLKYRVTDDGLRDSLIGLAGAGRSKDWVKRHSNLRRPAGDYVRLEQDSSLIRTFQAILVPGLLQTPEYARTVLTQIDYQEPQDLERSVAYRMARHEVLTRADPAQLRAVIGEGVLRQRLGGTEIMHGQLQHLLEMHGRANISVRVLPFEATRHLGIDGSFSLLDVEAGNFTIAVVDSMARSTFVEEPEEVDRYTMVFQDLWITALSEMESHALIERTMGEVEATPKQGLA